MTSEAVPPTGPAFHEVLRDLAEVLPASLDAARLAADATAYVRVFLDASGAAMLLADEDAQGLMVAAAEGSLAGHAGERVAPSEGGVAVEATALERPVLADPAAGPHAVFGDVRAPAVIAAPLHAHGVTAGAIVAVGGGGRPFTAEDLRLLSAVATHTAVVLANARYFAMVQRGKRQWEATFDALSDGVAITDEAALVLRANTSFAALVKGTLPSLLGRHVGEALFGDRHSLHEWLDAARSGARSPALIRRSDRLGRILRLTAAAIPAEAGAGALVVTVEDITEQKALEAQLIQSEKMAAVGTLVSGVAHELNNPMTSIAGLAEFLLEQPPGTVPDRDHLRVIAEEAQRAGSIVRNLLTFARKGPAERGPLAMTQVVERTLFLMGYELKLHGITVEKALADGVPPVLGDRDQLQQVILNLLTNASQALATLPAGLPRRIVVAVCAERDRVMVRVSDSGLGIPADVLPQVFSPFFTTKPLGEGTGLGLFISNGIVEGHGGSLTVDSRPGAGATFTVALPVAPAGSAAARRAEPGAPAPAAAPGRRILVIDDDQGVRRMVSALFAREGHTVDAVADGEAGLRLARETAYDLVIADRRAAAEGGPFLEALLRHRPEWTGRVLLSTGSVRTSQAGAGALPDERLLRKPFNLRDLRSAAAAVWSAADPG